jgi:ribosome-associated toxin RatA of RatAB toxin-antitoxin module
VIELLKRGKRRGRMGNRAIDGIRGLATGVALLSLLGCHKSEAPGYSEEIVKSEKGFTMKMQMSIAGEPARVYRTLTDFEHFSEFMPQCSSAEIVRREGNTVVLEIRRFVKFLGKNLVGRVEYELHPNRISVRSLNHPLADFHEKWSLEPGSGDKGTRILYTADSTMKVPMPDYMCQAWLRDNFKETLAAVETRILESLPTS